MQSKTNVLLLLLLATLVMGCNNNRNANDPSVRRVKIEVAQTADTLRVDEFSGIVRESAELNLAFRVAGRIEEIFVREGDFVNAGQLVALMDARDYEIQLQVAQAQYQQVKAEAERVIELHNRQSVASNDYDKAVAGLRMVEAQLAHAQNQRNDTRLVAPVSGFIQRVNFRQNELVDAGMPIVKIIEVKQKFVDVDIPVSLFMQRDKIVSYIGLQAVEGAAPFKLSKYSVDKRANQNQLHRLRLSVVDSESLPNLSPGMDIRVKILSHIKEDIRVSVPLSAVFYRDGNSYVWVYDSGSQAVSSRQVQTTNLISDGRILLVSGLNPGELVVIAGVNLISENERVLPIEPISATNVGGLL